MVNKMMLKMFADFLGTSPEEIGQMIADGHQAIVEGLVLMRQFDARMARIEKALGIVESTVITIEGNQNAEGNETDERNADAA